MKNIQTLQSSSTTFFYFMRYTKNIFSWYLNRRPSSSRITRHCTREFTENVLVSRLLYFPSIAEYVSSGDPLALGWRRPSLILIFVAPGSHLLVRSGCWWWSRE